MRSIEELVSKLEEVMEDERLHYPTATIVENAPLALIQLQLKTERDMLCWILMEQIPDKYRELRREWLKKAR